MPSTIPCVRIALAQEVYGASPFKGLGKKLAQTLVQQVGKGLEVTAVPATTTIAAAYACA
jgi:hypothetical protein